MGNINLRGQNIIFAHKNMRIILIHLLGCKIDFPRHIAIMNGASVSGIGRASAILEKLELISLINIRSARHIPYRKKSKIRKEFELTNKGMEIARLLFQINAIKLPRIKVKNIKSLLNYGKIE